MSYGKFPHPPLPASAWLRTVVRLLLVGLVLGAAWRWLDLKAQELVEANYVSHYVAEADAAGAPRPEGPATKGTRVWKEQQILCHRTVTLVQGKRYTNEVPIRTNIVLRGPDAPKTPKTKL